MRLFLLLAFSFCVCFLHGQEVRRYSFTRLSTSNGLSSNFVNDVVQDKDGYMWIATINGLQRYDGYNYITVNSTGKQKGHLSTSNITRLFKDSKQNVWVISSDHKLGILDTRRIYFDEVPVAYPKNKIIGDLYFFETPDGDLILHERFGDLYKFDPVKRSFALSKNFIPAPPGWRVDQISLDPNTKKYWMSGDSGISVYDPISKHLSYRGDNKDNDPVINVFKDQAPLYGVRADNQGNISCIVWLRNAGAPFLKWYNYRTKELKEVSFTKELQLGYHEIMGFLQQKSGRYWVYGNPFITEWVKDKDKFINIPNEFINEQSIKYDKVNSMLEDRETNLWVATDNGLYVFNPATQVFTSHNLGRKGIKGDKEAPVQAIAETEDKIFVGCWGAGIYCYDKNLQPLPLPASLKPYQDVASVWDMQIHSKTNKLWIVQQEGLILVHDLKTGTSTTYTPGIFNNRTIRQITEDKEGNLWMGTQGGKVIKWNYKSSGGDPSRGYTLVHTGGLVHKLFTDKQGFIWAATLVQGLVKIDPEKNRVVKVYKKEGPQGMGLSNNTPMDVFQNDDSTLIVLTDCINVLNINTHKIRQITSDDGLPSNTVICGETDKDGILWIGMMNGLCRVNLSKNIFTTYDRRDGIAYDNFSISGANRLSDSTMLFTTDHNFLSFNPEKVVYANTAIQPSIASFKVGGKTLSLDSLFGRNQIQLAYNNNSVVFEFSSLSYLNQKKLNYLYMLENLDKDWVQAGQQNQAIYNYLPPGDYVFKVKTVNADGADSIEARSFHITVKPPFWRTWWFYGLVVLIIIAILLWLDKERLNRIKAMQKVRSDIAGNLHSELNVALNNINILSEMAMMKADKDIHRSKEFMQQIKTKSHNMIISMDDMLWSINPANDPVKEMMIRLKEFIDSLQSRHESFVHLNIDKKLYGLELDMRKRHELFLMFKLALRMIVEDGHGKHVQINIDHAKTKMIFKVKDEGASVIHPTAFAAKEAQLTDRATTINALADVQVDNKGIAIIVQMPL